MRKYSILIVLWVIVLNILETEYMQWAQFDILLMGVCFILLSIVSNFTPFRSSVVYVFIIFCFSNEEEDENDSYDIAYRTEAPCDTAFSCPVSFLKLLLFNLYSDTGS